MADLHESGQIEADADVVVFVYRYEVNFTDSPDEGPDGTVRAAFLGSYLRFENLAPGGRAGYGFDSAA